MSMESNTWKDAVLSLREAVDRPYVILGKGPSAERYSADVGNGHRVLTLNHACRLAGPKAHVNHFIDVAAYRDCRDSLEGHYTCLPWRPHINNKASKFTLYDLIQEEPILQARQQEGRLLSYNSTSAGFLAKNPKLSTVRVRYFSAVAAFNLLAMAGIRRIDTLGIDGGTCYAQYFEAKDCLANGLTSFDVQFSEIQRTVRQHGLTWVKL